MQHIRRDDIPQYRAPGRERLARLAVFLEQMPEGLLTFTRWYGHGRGCAVGIAAAECPWIQAQGLRLAESRSARTSHPVYGDNSDWAAVTGFFEITLDDAQRLFTAVGYDGDVRPSPATVAARIRAHIAAAVPAAA